MTPGRRALDRVLVERGEAADLDEARSLVASGRVLVGGAPAMSPSRAVSGAEPIVIVEPARFVGRGGDKLWSALTTFELDVTGAAALDAGASTGGFTDCLLQAGAARVLAVDVGHGQLHERIGADPRVASLERVNLRDLEAEAVLAHLGRLADVAVVDLSFTSLVPHASHLVELGGTDCALVALVKPQFEVPSASASKGKGVISDPVQWRDAVVRCASALSHAGAGIMDVMASPLRGAAGNVEFFVLAQKGATGADVEGLARLVDRAVEAAPAP
jgi:23S rRNA (cytidine1920-2'-O)/16S rRNA (cytidine1409-2'-O)-methyltransferase